VNTPTLRRTQEQVTSTFEDVIDKLEELAGTLTGEAEKAGADVHAVPSTSTVPRPTT